MLGYIQRGGEPSVNDRIVAMQMGVRAVELALKGIFNKAIGYKNDEVFEVTIDQALKATKDFNYEKFHFMSCGLSACCMQP